MKVARGGNGPFQEHPRFSLAEFEEIAEVALKSVDLMPASPGPIRIERFVEKRFGQVVRYEELDSSVLGYTTFGDQGVESVVVSRALESDRSVVSQRRLSTTLAHEGAHGLLHADLFAKANEAKVASLFGSNQDVEAAKILCRKDGGQGTGDSYNRGYDGRWWEFQANQVMGALLIPLPLLRVCIEPLLSSTGSLGLKVLAEEARIDAETLLSETFDVNSIVAKIRLMKFHPTKNDQQLTL